MMYMKFLVLTLSILLVSYSYSGTNKNDNKNKGSRVIVIIASNEGFYPPNITVFSGEKITFVLTTITKDKSCFMLPEKNIFLTAKRGNIVSAETKFDTTGEYSFYCPSGDIKGKILVIDRCKK
ncbi:MAG: cupredoxin domain-containing protein [Oligoflexia bacterium]|nr:cupredoxin domain-containing protein [Oligoflexia bacterium]